MALLKPVTGKLVINSQPGGADVWINGQNRGGRPRRSTTSTSSPPARSSFASRTTRPTSRTSSGRRTARSPSTPSSGGERPHGHRRGLAVVPRPLISSVSWPVSTASPARLAVVAIALVACKRHNPGGDDTEIDAAYEPDACEGLGCFIVDCASKGLSPTTVSGTIYAPNGTLPLYGVNVYIPISDPARCPPARSATSARTACSAGVHPDRDRRGRTLRAA